MVDQFVPGPSSEFYTDEQMKDVIEEVAPGGDVECIWAHFLASNYRTKNPRRRIGGDCMRIGPMLFAPCQYTRRTDGEPD